MGKKEGDLRRKEIRSVEKEENKNGCKKEGWIRKDGGWECMEVERKGGKGVAGREEEERRKGGCWEQ
jgi:hypothetical protein